MIVANETFKQCVGLLMNLNIDFKIASGKDVWYVKGIKSPWEIDSSYDGNKVHYYYTDDPDEDSNTENNAYLVIKKLQKYFGDNI